MRQLLLIVILGVSFTSALEQVLQITKISRIMITEGSMKTEVDHFEIEVTNSVDAGGFDHFHLNIHTVVGDLQYQGDSVLGSTSKNKATFKHNLADLTGEVDFFLTQRDTDDKPVSYGVVTFTLPVFPSGVESTWVGVSDDYSLRIKDKSTVGDFKVSNRACTETTTTAKEPCYFVDVTKDAEGELCVQVTATMKKKIEVCDKTFSPGDVTSSTAVNPDTTELQYAAGGGTATVSVSLTHLTKTITSTEVIVYKEDKKTVHACSVSPCSIGSSTTNDIFTVITVGIDDTSLPADTGTSKVTDYGVIGTVLSNSLIETRWTRQSDQDKYYVSTVGTASFNATTATCADASNGDNFHCFAYFTGLAQEIIYPLTVKITEDAAPLLVTLTDTTTGKDVEDMEMKISSLNTKWNKGLRSFEVNVCIHDVDTFDLSSYQAILINKIGQWKKIDGVTQRIENKFCFDELRVDIHDFNLSENLTLVAVKRGHDGITVLESVQTIISV